MPQLSAIESSEIDPRLVPHLAPGETVLWQMRPDPGRFASPRSALTGVVSGTLGLAIVTGLFDRVTGVSLEGQPRLLPGLVLVALGVIGVMMPRLSARRVRVYAVTDRRLLVVRGSSVYRSVRPEEIRELYTRRNAVCWRELGFGDTSKSNSAEARYPGFHGVEDPDALLAFVEDWREAFSRRAADAASDFLASRQDAGEELDGHAVSDGAVDLPGDGRQQVRHPGTGLTLEVPEGWPVTIRQDKDGPLVVFGVTLLKRIIRPGPERPLESGGDWNLMLARGGPDAGIGMKILPGPIPQTYEEVLNDPWSRRFKLKLLQSNPEVVVGPFRGFSVVRQMPEGANLQMFGQVAAPVAVRQIWLARGDIHVQFMGIARLDQHEVQGAVDAAVASLRVS